MLIQIVCITTAGGRQDDPHERITRLGWVDQMTGERGTSSREEMYDYVGRGGIAFTQGGAARAQVISYLSRSGRKCVKTVPDSTKKDNLLNLDECR